MDSQRNAKMISCLIIIITYFEVKLSYSGLKHTHILWDTFHVFKMSFTFTFTHTLHICKCKITGTQIGPQSYTHQCTLYACYD